MLILDRYLLGQFTKNFLACFISLTGLFVVIDLFGNLDDILQYSSKNGNFWAITTEYYGYRTLGFFDRTSGILTLIAAMFTVAMFQRFNELTAIQAAGIPKRRVVAPVVVAAVLISVLAAMNREVVISSVRERFSLNAQDLGGENGKAMQPKRDLMTDIVLAGKRTFANKKRIEAPAFTLRGKLAADFDRQIVAADAFYQPPDGHHPGGYLLKGVSQPKDLAKRPSKGIDDGETSQTVIYTPLDNKWLAADECFIASDVTFEHLTSVAEFRQNASLAELVSGLKNPSLGFGADMRTAVHARLVQPLLDVVLLFLGLPLILARGNRNIFLAIGLCVAVVVVFYLVVLGCQYLGSSYLVSPAIGAWLPLLLFVPAATWLSQPLLE